MWDLKKQKESQDSYDGFSLTEGCSGLCSSVDQMVIEVQSKSYII